MLFHRCWFQKYGGMGQIVTTLVSLCLLVLLFTAIARRAPDDRLRCWVAAWVGILVHTALRLSTPENHFLRLTVICAAVDALGLAAIFLLVSTMVLREGRRTGLRYGSVLALFALPCLTMSVAFPHAGGIAAASLAVLVVARLGAAVYMGMRPSARQPLRLSIAFPVAGLSLAWMLYGIAHGHSQIVLFSLLGEMFFIAGLNFWFAGWPRTLGLITTSVGLTVFGAMFPGLLLIERTWPGGSTYNHLFGVASLGAAVGMILIVFEEHLRSLRQTTDEYRLIFDTNPHPLWIVDTETLEFMAANESACAKHGYTREEFAKLRLPDILEKNMTPRVLKQVSLPAPISNRASRHLRKDGTAMAMDITAHSIIFRERPSRFVLGIDVSEREELERQVMHQSRHDSLTGLANRMLFEEQLQSALHRASDAKEKLAVLCFNLDRFKRINDTYGTGIGDECLKRVAGILLAHAGPAAMVARSGGDRFALILSGLRSGLPVEHVLLETMEEFREPVVMGETRIRLSVSAGLALYPDDGDAAGPLWRSAESALAQAMAAGGWQVVWSSPNLRIAAEQQVELEAFMRAQLEKGGFHLEYQPIFAMDGGVEGLEALLRLTHPVRGPISPCSFIPLAEETGLIVPIGEWVLEEVCRQLCAWRTDGIRLVPIAVNVSGHQLMRSGFAERLVALLSRFRIAPELIDLEVTESTDMFNMAEVTRQMALLSEIGMRFSIDDFGTGHSTLNRLDKLPIRVLKVDRVFTERLCAVNGSRSIVKAIISMSRALNIRVVVEGVEREEQLAALREIGCDYVQGLLLSRPVSPSAVPQVLEGRHLLLANAQKFHV